MMNPCSPLDDHEDRHRSFNDRRDILAPPEVGRFDEHLWGTLVSGISVLAVLT